MLTKLVGITSYTISNHPVVHLILDNVTGQLYLNKNISYIDYMLK